MLSSVVYRAVKYCSIFSLKKWKKFLNVKCVLIFSTNLTWNICHSKKISAKCYDECTVHGSSRKVPLIRVRFLTKFEFSRQIVGKYSNIKFHENPSSLSRVPCRQINGQTDGETDITKSLVSFLSFVNTPDKTNAVNIYLYGALCC